jgi:hypothetical protein
MASFSGTLQQRSVFHVKRQANAATMSDTPSVLQHRTRLVSRVPFHSSPTKSTTAALASPPSASFDAKAITHGGLIQGFIEIKENTESNTQRGGKAGTPYWNSACFVKTCATATRERRRRTTAETNLNGVSSPFVLHVTTPPPKTLHLRTGVHGTVCLDSTDTKSSPNPPSAGPVGFVMQGSILWRLGAPPLSRS